MRVFGEIHAAECSQEDYLRQTLGNECVISTQGEIRIAPAGSGMPRSRKVTSILTIIPPPAESPAKIIVGGS